MISQHDKSIIKLLFSLTRTQIHKRENRSADSEKFLRPFIFFFFAIFYSTQQLLRDSLTEDPTVVAQQKRDSDCFLNHHFLGNFFQFNGRDWRSPFRLLEIYVMLLMVKREKEPKECEKWRRVGRDRMTHVNWTNFTAEFLCWNILAKFLWLIPMHPQELNCSIQSQQHDQMLQARWRSFMFEA